MQALIPVILSSYVDQKKMLNDTALYLFCEFPQVFGGIPGGGFEWKYGCFPWNCTHMDGQLELKST